MFISTTRCLSTPDANSATIVNQESAPWEWTHRAEEIIANENLCHPAQDRLLLIVEAGLEALALYFAASLQEPTAADLYSYFEDFIIRVLHSDPNEEPVALQ